MWCVHACLRDFEPVCPQFSLPCCPGCRCNRSERQTPQRRCCAPHAIQAAWRGRQGEHADSRWRSVLRRHCDCCFERQRSRFRDRFRPGGQGQAPARYCCGRHRPVHGAWPCAEINVRQPRAYCYVRVCECVCACIVARRQSLRGRVARRSPAWPGIAGVRKWRDV